MAEEKILISKANSEDYRDIFHLYYKYMYDSYFLKLGEKFLKKYLRKLLSLQHVIVFVAMSEKPVGFIIATTNSQRLVKDLFFDFNLSFTFLKIIAYPPQKFLRGLEIIFYPIFTFLKGVKAEFLSIAITPEYRRRGLGKKLIEKVLNEFAKMGIRKTKVTTLDKNVSVNLLLEKMNFKLQRKFILLGKIFNFYTYEIH